VDSAIPSRVGGSFVGEKGRGGRPEAEGECFDEAISLGRNTIMMVFPIEVLPRQAGDIPKNRPKQPNRGPARRALFPCAMRDNKL
jgi:hypothetical protein